MYQISINDVVRSGSVEQAVIDEMPGDILIADESAMGGQTFVTSGPGPGWTKTLGATDYASAAIAAVMSDSGCMPSEVSVIDPTDGRIAHGVNPDAGEDWGGEVEWEDDSSVELVAPSVREVASHPDAFAKMWESRESYPQDGHWAELVETIKAIARVISG